MFLWAYGFERYPEGIFGLLLIKHCDQKQLVQDRVYFVYTSTSLFIPEGKHSKGRNLEVGAGAEATEGCWLLACSPWLPQPPFLKNPGPSGHGCQRQQWAGLSMWENALHACLHHDLIEQCFSTFLSQCCDSLVQFLKLWRSLTIKLFSLLLQY